MKYLHISPPWYVFHGQNNLRQPNVPLGAAYCARAALRAGWQAAIWNGDLLPQGGENQYSEEMTSYEDYLVNHARKENPVWNELRTVLREVRPDVVGITALTASYPSALRTAEVVKEELPNTKVVIGGPHATAMPEEVAARPQVDAAVFGEGERSLEELLHRWRRGERIAGTAGVAAKVGAMVLKGPPRNYEEDLDVFGWPARGVVWDRYGLMNKDNYGLVMMSRGCPFPCEFCASPSLWTRGVRWRSAGDLAHEMVAIHKEYDTRYFSFEDDTFTLHRTKTLQLMDAIIDTGLPSVAGFRWTCNTRPERLDEYLLERMKAAGCAAVAVGIEFGSERMLRKAKKQFTAEQVRRSIRMIKSAGLISSGQFMIGYPTESEQEMWETASLADEIECESVMLSVATPLPATPLYDEARELALIPREGIDWATVTTKNNGMLMTVEKDGRHVPMPADERLRIVQALQAEFDRIQLKTLAAKNASRNWYEAQYLPEDAVAPAYGFRKTVADVDVT
jgi:radical SAM superfamily enzyme YgiQ (UPF0313 family)